MKVLNRLKTTAYSRDVIEEHIKELRAIAISISEKKGNAIAPHGKLDKKNFVLYYLTVPDNEEKILERLELQYNFGDSSLSIQTDGSSTTLSMDRVPWTMSSYDFKDYKDILNAYTEIVNDDSSIDALFEEIEYALIEYLKKH